MSNMRSTIVFTLAFCLAVALAACGATNVGGGCSSASDCAQTGQDGGTVIRAVCLNTPGGYCSVPCNTAGSDAGCPSGSMCAVYPSGSSTNCIQLCTMQSDCRSGYNCNGITNTSVKGCQ
jgi:hypothetical protein